MEKKISRIAKEGKEREKSYPRIVQQQRKDEMLYEVERAHTNIAFLTKVNILTVYDMYYIY